MSNKDTYTRINELHSLVHVFCPSSMLYGSLSFSYKNVSAVKLEKVALRTIVMKLDCKNT